MHTLVFVVIDPKTSAIEEVREAYKEDGVQQWEAHVRRLLEACRDDLVVVVDCHN